MPFENLTSEEWRRFSDAEKISFAERLAAHLPQRVRATTVQTFALADKQETLAVFDYDGAAFVLIPGGTVTVGHDAGRFCPTSAQVQSFQDSASEYGIKEGIQEFVQQVTTPSRAVQVKPMLVEVATREIGLEPAPADSPAVRKLLKEHPGAGQVELNKSLRVRRERDGSVQAWRIVRKTHPELTQELSAVGMRLPISDEWEYLCGAGASTLFRWGDRCPCDRYPTDHTLAEARRKRAWVLSGGRIDFHPDEPDWDLHLRPNAFGLRIASNPYDCEVVAEEKVVRGGDGGCNICGGVGFFLGWLPLGTAYRDEAATSWLDEDIRNLFFRRVIPVE